MEPFTGAVTVITIVILKRKTMGSENAARIWALLIDRSRAVYTTPLATVAANAATKDATLS